MNKLSFIPRAGVVLVRPAPPGQTVRGVEKPKTVQDRERPIYGVIVASGVESLPEGQIVGWDHWAGSTVKFGEEKLMVLSGAEIRFTLTPEVGCVSA